MRCTNETWTQPKFDVNKLPNPARKVESSVFSLVSQSQDLGSHGIWDIVGEAAVFENSLSEYVACFDWRKRDPVIDLRSFNDIIRRTCYGHLSRIRHQKLFRGATFVFMRLLYYTDVPRSLVEGPPAVNEKGRWWERLMEAIKLFPS